MASCRVRRRMTALLAPTSPTAPLLHLTHLPSPPPSPPLICQRPAGRGEEDGLAAPRQGLLVVVAGQPGVQAGAASRWGW